jgi:hypothetical protein
MTWADGDYLTLNNMNCDPINIVTGKLYDSTVPGLIYDSGATFKFPDLLPGKKFQ